MSKVTEIKIYLVLQSIKISQEVKAVNSEFMLKGMQEWVYHAFPESSPGSHSFPGYLHEMSPQFIAGIAPPPEAGLWRAPSAAISLCCQRTQLCKWRTETLQSVKPKHKFSESTSSVRSCDTVSLTLTGGRARITGREGGLCGCACL